MESTVIVDAVFSQLRLLVALPTPGFEQDDDGSNESKARQNLQTYICKSPPDHPSGNPAHDRPDAFVQENVRAMTRGNRHSSVLPYVAELVQMPAFALLGQGQLAASVARRLGPMTSMAVSCSMPIQYVNTN